MTRTMISVAFVGAMLLTSRGMADPTVPLAPGSLQEQRLVLPPREADVAQIFEQLDGKDEGVKESALQWLLRREEAEKLPYFHTGGGNGDAARFSCQL
jgi:hypothetical protein